MKPLRALHISEKPFRWKGNISSSGPSLCGLLRNRLARSRLLMLHSLLFRRLSRRLPLSMALRPLRVPPRVAGPPRRSWGRCVIPLLGCCPSHSLLRCRCRRVVSSVQSRRLRMGRARPLTPLERHLSHHGDGVLSRMCAWLRRVPVRRPIDGILALWVRAIRGNRHLNHNHLPFRFRESVRLGAGPDEQDEVDEEQCAEEAK